MGRHQCQHISKEGVQCQEEAISEGLCYWHSSENLKTEADLKQRLEQQAAKQQPMHEYDLRRTDLNDVNLVNHGAKQGFDLRHCDLYRANMQKAHLFAANLENASLMKADLRGANLHCANLKNANLLGTRLEDARLDHVHWGHYVIQEQLARKSNDRAVQLDYFEQAEEVYRNLRRVLETEGLFEQAGYFFRREMVMRRYQMPLWSTSRLVSRVVDLFCGYGERPLRVMLFSVVLILGFAVIFFSNGVVDGDQLLQFNPDNSFGDNLSDFLNVLYFSIVTFTTLGYGDITPVGWNRFFTAAEAFSGSFTLALFVVVFVKKMTR